MLGLTCLPGIIGIHIQTAYSLLNTLRIQIDWKYSVQFFIQRKTVGKTKMGSKIGKGHLARETSLNSNKCAPAEGKRD